MQLFTKMQAINSQLVKAEASYLGSYTFDNSYDKYKDNTPLLNAILNCFEALFNAKVLKDCDINNIASLNDKSKAIKILNYLRHLSFFNSANRVNTLAFLNDDRKSMHVVHLDTKLSFAFNIGTGMLLFVQIIRTDAYEKTLFDRVSKLAVPNFFMTYEEIQLAQSKPYFYSQIIVRATRNNFNLFNIGKARAANLLKLTTPFAKLSEKELTTLLETIDYNTATRESLAKHLNTEPGQIAMSYVESFGKVVDYVHDMISMSAVKSTIVQREEVKLLKGVKSAFCVLVGGHPAQNESSVMLENYLTTSNIRIDKAFKGVLQLSAVTDAINLTIPEGSEVRLAFAKLKTLRNLTFPPNYVQNLVAYGITNTYELKTSRGCLINVITNEAQLRQAMKA